MKKLSEQEKKLYWKTNIQYVLFLLTIWAFVSFGLSIFWADSLNKIEFLNFKLGFWFAQQGSIFIFCLIIFAYIQMMKKLDKKFGVDQ